MFIFYFGRVCGEVLFVFFVFVFGKFIVFFMNIDADIGFYILKIGISVYNYLVCDKCGILYE